MERPTAQNEELGKSVEYSDRPSSLYGASFWQPSLSKADNAEKTSDFNCPLHDTHETDTHEGESPSKIAPSTSSHPQGGTQSSPGTRTRYAQRPALRHMPHKGPSDLAHTGFRWPGRSNEEMGHSDAGSASPPFGVDRDTIKQVSQIDAQEFEAPRSTEQTQRRSHINTRMIDVGGKPATRRVAIACCHVTFSNPEPYRLMMARENPKGDVLATAQIAGIMAAKRTPDLIPLCHPIAITKADVDLHLLPPDEHTAGVRRNSHGVVTVQATIESVGPTGVEMEALAAVTAAALTVYDMSKAFDKGIAIRDARVVYKSGGKSGLTYDSRWASSMGEQHFQSRGLEAPSAMGWSARNSAEEIR